MSATGEPTKGLIAGAPGLARRLQKSNDVGPRPSPPHRGKGIDELPPVRRFAEAPVEHGDYPAVEAGAHQAAGPLGQQGGGPRDVNQCERPRPQGRTPGRK